MDEATRAIQERARYARYREENRGIIRERDRKRREEQAALLNERTRLSRHKQWDAYLTKNNERCRQQRVTMKSRAVAALGGKCVSCGYDADIRALQIDHINGDGPLDRKERKSQHALYRDIAALGGLGRYQLLCANCNVIKRIEAKEHPKGKPRTKYV